MKRYFYKFLLALIVIFSSQAGFLDDINHPDAPKGVIKNAQTIAKDPLFDCVGMVCSGLLDQGVRPVSTAVLVSPTTVLCAKHSLKEWSDEKPTHQFFSDFRRMYQKSR